MNLGKFKEINEESLNEESVHDIEKMFTDEFVENLTVDQEDFFLEMFSKDDIDFNELGSIVEENQNESVEFLKSVASTVNQETLVEIVKNGVDDYEEVLGSDEDKWKENILSLTVQDQEDNVDEEALLVAATFFGGVFMYTAAIVLALKVKLAIMMKIFRKRLANAKKGEINLETKAYKLMKASDVEPKLAKWDKVNGLIEGFCKDPHNFTFDKHKEALQVLGFKVTEKSAKKKGNSGKAMENKDHVNELGKDLVAIPGGLMTMAMISGMTVAAVFTLPAFMAAGTLMLGYGFTVVGGVAAFKKIKDAMTKSLAENGWSHDSIIKNAEVVEKMAEILSSRAKLYSDAKKSAKDLNDPSKAKEVKANASIMKGIMKGEAKTIFMWIAAFNDALKYVKPKKADK